MLWCQFICITRQYSSNETSFRTKKDQRVTEVVIHHCTSRVYDGIHGNSFHIFNIMNNWRKGGMEFYRGEQNKMFRCDSCVYLRFLRWTKYYLSSEFIGNIFRSKGTILTASMEWIQWSFGYKNPVKMKLTWFHFVIDFT